MTYTAPPLRLPGSRSLTIPITRPFNIDKSCVLCLLPEYNTKWIDHSGKGNHGTFTNTSKKIGRLGDAASFNGSDSKVLIGNDASLNVTDAVTMEGWVYNEYLGSTYPRIIDKDPGPVMYLLQTVDVLAWYGEIDGVSQDVPFGDADVFANVWMHTAITYANDAEHALKAYINGQLKQTITTYSGALTTTAKNLYVGDRDGTARPFDGLIDEVRMYNRALAAWEIKALYDIGAP